MGTRLAIRIKDDDVAPGKQPHASAGAEEKLYGAMMKFIR